MIIPVAHVFDKWLRYYHTQKLRLSHASKFNRSRRSSHSSPVESQESPRRAASDESERLPSAQIPLLLKRIDRIIKTTTSELRSSWPFTLSLRFKNRGSKFNVASSSAYTRCLDALVSLRQALTQSGVLKYGYEKWNKLDGKHGDLGESLVNAQVRTVLIQVCC